MVIVEIVTFPSSEAYLKNPTETAKPPLDFLPQIDGSISSHYGVQNEDKKTGYFVNVWETYEHHVKLTKRDDFPQLIESLKPSMDGEPDIRHVTFSADPTSVLVAPTTEFVVVNVKEENLKEELGSALNAMVAELAKYKVVGVWGEVKEYPGTFVFAAGWESAEAHVQTVKGDAFAPLFQKLKSVVDPASRSVFHVNFQSK